MGILANTLTEIRKGLIEELWKLMSKAQYITKWKEIKQYPNETIWDFDQRLKMPMARFSFYMSDVQHKECFIMALVLHIRIHLMQHNIATQSEALNIMLKLEA